MIGGGRRDLLVVGRLLNRRLPGSRAGLLRWIGRDVGLGDGRRAARRGAQLPEAILELPVAVLQLLILAGELSQLVLKLLDPDFRIDVVRLLSKRRRGGREHRGHHGRARSRRKSGRHVGLTNEIGVTETQYIEGRSTPKM